MAATILGFSIALKISDLSDVTSGAGTEETTEETRVNKQITGGTARPSTLAVMPAAPFRKSTRDGFIATNVYFVYIIFPSIVRMSFETFQCQEICSRIFFMIIQNTK